MMELSFSETCPRKMNVIAAGMYVSERISDPNKANTTVSAIGLNILPSIPVNERIGRQTIMMIATAKTTGRPTSAQASRIVFIENTVSEFLKEPWRRYVASSEGEGIKV